MTRELKKNVESKVRDLCEELGYVYKKKFFIKEDYPNIQNGLYFTYLQDKKACKINLNATVVISLIDLEIKKRHLLEVNKADFSFTLSQNLSFLMPDKKYIEWSFNERNYSTVLENLKNCILNFGQPYFDKLNSPDKIISGIENRTERLLNKDFNFYMPIIYLIRGQLDKGVNFIRDVIKEQATVLTEEELRKKYLLPSFEHTPILRAGIDRIDCEELQLLLNDLQEITIVGGTLGSGEVDPTYLVFARNYIKYINKLQNQNDF